MLRDLEATAAGLGVGDPEGEAARRDRDRSEHRDGEPGAERHDKGGGDAGDQESLRQREDEDDDRA